MIVLTGMMVCSSLNDQYYYRMRVGLLCSLGEIEVRQQTVQGVLFLITYGTFRWPFQF